jgi:hypothetical protein
LDTGGNYKTRVLFDEEDSPAPQKTRIHTTSTCT